MIGQIGTHLKFLEFKTKLLYFYVYYGPYSKLQLIIVRKATFQGIYVIRTNLSSEMQNLNGGYSIFYVLASLHAQALFMRVLNLTKRGVLLSFITAVILSRLTVTCAVRA